jgi:predicted Zn-dependent protease
MKKKSNWLFAMVFICLLGACIYPPASRGITIHQEEQLSREYLNYILQRYEIIEDPLIVNYVRSISQRIMAVVPPQPFKYHFYVVKEDVYNAFATPAGHIFIHSGLIEAMDGEDELAGILAHEISHVVCRHISDSIERSKKLQVASIAGMLAAALAAVGGAGEAASAITTGSMAATQSAMLSYSRDNELQADEIGLKYLHKAGYSGEGLMRVLKKIRSKTWYGKDLVPTYLRTHPASEDRIAYIDTWLQTHPNESADFNTFDNTAFLFARTRLKALYADQSLALTQFQNAVDRDPDSYLDRYGLGLTYSRTGRFKDAEVQFKAALKKRALDPYLLTALGQSYFLSGEYQRALTIFESISSLDYFIHENELYLGRAQLEMGQLNDAEFTLEKLISHATGYNDAHYFLGEAYGRQRKEGLAHYHLGLFYYRKRNVRNALFHLNKAMQKLDDPAKKSDVERILKKLKADEKKLAESKRR